MKNWRPLLLAALAALSLQACEVRVNSGSTKVQEPQAALPENTPLNTPATTTAAAPPPIDAAAAARAPAEAASAAIPAPEATAQAPLDSAPVAPPVPATTAQAPLQPETGMLGAPGAVPDAAAAATAGTAAPTELARFFEANAPGAAKGDDKTRKPLR